MTTTTKKTISYVVFIAADIAALIVTVAAVQLTFYAPSIELSTELLAGIWGILVPLSAGLLTAALIVAISLLAAPVLACAWLVNELTSRSRNRRHAVIPAPFLPYRVHISSVGPLNPSGRVARGGFVGTTSQPAGKVKTAVGSGIAGFKPKVSEE